MYDLVIVNGKIIDGTGNPWYKADIGIKDEKIVKISSIPLTNSGEIIHADNYVVCPGFINLHSHSDYTILSHNNAENCLAMGLVTELTGQCGLSVAPIQLGNNKVKEKNKKDMERFSLKENEVCWNTFGEWIKEVEKKGIGINIAPLVGHGTIRSNVMGLEGEGGEKIVPSKDELNEMKNLLDDSMKEGAFGLSTGLIYPPGRNALTQEISELLTIVSKYGGVHISHIRCQGPKLLASTREFIEICQKNNIPGSLSHYKAHGVENFGKVHEALRIIDEARKNGVNIIIDQYPWKYGSTSKSLGGIFKPDVRNLDELLKKLKDNDEWRILKKSLIKRRENEKEEYRKRNERMQQYGWWAPEPYIMYKKSLILYSKNHPILEGKFFDEVAKYFGEDDKWDGIRRLLLEDDGYTCYGTEPYNEEDIQTILKYPWTAISTDQYAMDNSKISFEETAQKLAIQNPRGWGSYPKVLETYVREKKLLSLEDAIRKMTSLPARFLGLYERGIISEGFYADILVLDPKNIKNKATYNNPMAFPEGVLSVLVNGKIAFDNGELRGSLVGRVLKH